MGRSGHAVVLGAGFAGMLAASVLARHVDEVTVVDRDSLPTGPEPRAGLPQARHGHLLMAAGAQALERLLPGFTAELAEVGARRLSLPGDLVSLTPHGWLPRLGEASHGWCLSRDLLDWMVRRRVLADPAVRLLDRTRAEDLLGTARRVDGVRVRHDGAGGSVSLSADLVIDATGRGSHAAHWLAELGAPGPEEQTVDCGLVYATMLVRPPEEAGRSFPSVNIQTGPGNLPGRAGVVFPIEDGRWLITLSATRGVGVPDDERGFQAFAATLPHPLLAQLLRVCRPLDRIHRYANTADRRRRFDRLRHAPAGLLVVGDAAAHTNPSYGHGLSVAALGVERLAARLARHGLPGADGPRGPRRGATARIQRDLARVAATAWTLATGQDVLYPNVRGTRSTRADLRRAELGGRLQRTATAALAADSPQGAVLAALVRIGTLEGRPADLIGPTLVSALVAPRTVHTASRPIADPPVSDAEIHSLGPDFRRVEPAAPAPAPAAPVPAPAAPDPVVTRAV